MLWDIAAAIFILAAAGQCAYLSILGRQQFRSGKVIVDKDYARVPQKTLLPVSVIICARNEAVALLQNLGSILSQDYHRHGEPLFEVIVVDDCSDDDTAAILKSFAEKHRHLRIVTISAAMERNFPGKKFALGQGVAVASFDYLVLTDADCSAGSNHWIRRMASPFLTGKDIVAGYGAYRPEKTLLNGFIRSETVFTFLQLHGMAMLGMPYMAVGRNLAVKKRLLIAAQQSELWIKTPSGDDDLLVRLYATAVNFIALTSPESYTYSTAKQSSKEYISQKQRHLSTGKYYRPAIKFWLGLNGLCHTLFWCLLPFIITGLLMHKRPRAMTVAVLIAAVLRPMMLYLTLSSWSRRLGEKRLSAFAPVFDFVMAGYNIIFAPYILWKTKQRWK